jgi:hypothetical protein
MGVLSALNGVLCLGVCLRPLSLCLEFRDIIGSIFSPYSFEGLIRSFCYTYMKSDLTSPMQAAALIGPAQTSK